MCWILHTRYTYLMNKSRENVWSKCHHYIIYLSGFFWEYSNHLTQEILSSGNARDISLPPRLAAQPIFTLHLTEFSLLVISNFYSINQSCECDALYLKCQINVVSKKQIPKSLNRSCWIQVESLRL